MIGECCAKERLAWQNHTWYDIDIDIDRSWWVNMQSWYPRVSRGDIPVYEEVIFLGRKSWYPRVWKVDIPGYEELISLGMKRSGNEGTMGKHEKTLRGGEEPPKKLPLVVLTAPQPLSTSSSPPTLQFKQKFGELWIDLITSVWTVYSTSAVSFK